MITCISIYYVLTLLLFLMKKSKVVVLLSLLYLIFLFSLNTNIADRANYEFVLHNDFFSTVELGWGWFISCVRQYGFSIQSLYPIIGIPYLITLFFILTKLSQNNRPIACYMVGMFFLDVVQLRFTFSAIFIWWAFYFFFLNDDKAAYLKYAFFILLASLIHASNLTFMVFLFAKCEKKSKVFGIMSIVFCTLAIGLPVVTMLFGRIFGFENKIDRIGGEMMSSSLSIVTCVFYLLFFVIMTLLMNYNTSQKENYIRYSENISILALSFLPLLSFSSDFRRHIFVTALLLIAVFFRYENKYKDRLLFLLPIFLFSSFFIYSTFSGNRETVFIPIFKNNFLIDYFGGFF